MKRAVGKRFQISFRYASQRPFSKNKCQQFILFKASFLLLLLSVSSLGVKNTRETTMCSFPLVRIVFLCCLVLILLV